MQATIVISLRLGYNLGVNFCMQENNIQSLDNQTEQEPRQIKRRKFTWKKLFTYIIIKHIL